MNIWSRIKAAWHPLELRSKYRFSSNVRTVLRESGWTENRDVACVEQEYIQWFGSLWLPEASRFVRSFGRLSISHKLWVMMPDVPSNDVVQRVYSVVGIKCCPVAFSNYMGEGCALWIDGRGRFFAVDDEGMLLIGESVESAFEVLIGGAPRPAAPELNEGLQHALHRNK